MPRSRDFLQRSSATSQGIGVTLGISVYLKKFIKIQIVTFMATIWLRNKMSVALNTFKRAINDARALIECYDELNVKQESQALGALKRAALIMTMTAWETYVEDVATELFNNKFGALKGCQIGNFMEQQFSTRLKMFHNPDSAKTKQIFEEFFGIDVTEHWKWSNYIPKQARETLNSWLKKRGDAVHRAQVEIGTPQIIKRDEVDKCIRFITELVTATDKALGSV
ncbi:MAG: hypothetical protein LRY75_17630 [Shewanella xiamenensis]|uniref:HEPN domain-containing protein n=2 Tax=Shewanellaceae TaxID=267890 RepID=UPI0021BF8AC3|nr:HEPN domain-containing protein [Shewanella xiamenensis]MCD8560598.1 hypothetical protein [Shewanella xiamenensis]